jgi:hypothetical protein
MRHRATTTIRVLDRCARCGTTYLPLYDVKKVIAAMPTPAGVRNHELVLCKGCQTHEGATDEERAAMGIDITNPVECMEYVQRYGAHPDRVRRTAEYFLGAKRYAQEFATTQAEFAERRAKREEWRDKQRAAEEEYARAHPGGTDFNNFDQEYDPEEDCG